MDSADSSLLLQVLLAFFVAGAWISLASLLGERLGSRIGGLVVNLPGNIVFSLLFIALSRGDDYAAQAAASTPVGMAIDTLFLLALIAGLSRGLLAGLFAGFLAWLGAAALALLLPMPPPLLGLAIYLVVCIGSFLVADRLLEVRAVPGRATPFRPSILLVRALFAGTIVASAVLIAQVAPPYLTGLAAVFPATILSTMVILSRAQGLAFARETGKVLIVSSANIVVYGLLATALFPRLGPWWGSLLSYVGAGLFVAALLPLARRIR
jgi:hypothetical protein